MTVYNYISIFYERLSCANYFLANFGPEYGGVQPFRVLGVWTDPNDPTKNGPVVEIVELGGFEGSRLCVVAEEIK